MKTLIELPSMGEMIRAELKKKDMPIKKFADEIGCGRQNIYYLLKKRTFDVELLAIISRVLKRNFVREYANMTQQWIENK